MPRARQLARSAGAILFVDAVHFAPHERVDVGTLGCDFLVCSPYKFYGPHVGVLWGRPDLLSEVQPPKLAPAPDTPPERWETGTLNHEGIAGAGAAVDFLASLADGPDRMARLDATFAELSRRGEELITTLWKGLAAVPGVRLYGPPPRNATYADALVHDRGPLPGRCGGSPGRRMGALPVARQLLRGRGDREPGSGTGRSAAGGLRVLHERRRDRTPDRSGGTAGHGRSLTTRDLRAEFYSTQLSMKRRSPSASSTSAWKIALQLLVGERPITMRC